MTKLFVAECFASGRFIRHLVFVVFVGGTGVIETFRRWGDDDEDDGGR